MMYSLELGWTEGSHCRGSSFCCCCCYWFLLLRWWCCHLTSYASAVCLAPVLMAQLQMRDEGREFQIHLLWVYVVVCVFIWACRSPTWRCHHPLPFLEEAGLEAVSGAEAVCLVSGHQLLHGLQNHTQLEEHKERQQVRDYTKIIRDAPIDQAQQPSLLLGVQCKLLHMLTWNSQIKQINTTQVRATSKMKWTASTFDTQRFWLLQLLLWTSFL